MKTARAFADSLDDSCGNSAFADAMMGLAKGLRTRVVAEGVERRDQLEKLISLGATCGRVGTSRLRSSALSSSRSSGIVPLERGST